MKISKVSVIDTTLVETRTRFRVMLDWFLRVKKNKVYSVTCRFNLSDCDPYYVVNGQVVVISTGERFIVVLSGLSMIVVKPFHHLTESDVETLKQYTGDIAIISHAFNENKA